MLAKVLGLGVLAVVYPIVRLVAWWDERSLFEPGRN